MLLGGPTKHAMSVLLVYLALVLLGCSQEKQPDKYDEPTKYDLYVAAQRLKRGGPSARADSARAAESPAATQPTGNADHDFLRAMSGHHKNVIILADAALDSNRRPEMANVIRKVEERHGHELDEISALLRTEFNDGSIPEASAEARSNADLIRRSGDNRTLFLNAVTKAENEALAIDGLHSSKGNRANVRRLAARIRAGEIGLISDLRRATAN